jgi:3-phenylpropionate/trans-cinnamate dioxygenase ferredoxin subunit
VAEIDIGAADELAPGNLKRVVVEGRDLLLVCTESGKLRLMNNLCSHDDVPLHLGCVKGETVKCSYHGSRFNVDTGCPLEEPAEDCVRTYPLEERDGRLFTTLD